MFHEMDKQVGATPNHGDVAAFLGIYRSDLFGEVGLPGTDDGFTIDAGEFVSTL